MDNSFEILKAELTRIRNLGWVECTRPNNKDGGIGNTLEDLLNVKENNIQGPDFLDFEIKSQKKMTDSPVSLFSKASENKGNRLIFNEYGVISSEDKVKRLYWTIYAHKESFLADSYYAKIDFIYENQEEVLVLSIYDENHKLLNNSAKWRLRKKAEQLEKKLKNLVYCVAEEEIRGNKKFFKYEEFLCYFNFSYDNFLNCIREGYIQVDMRMGADLNGKAAGKFHDHGTGFRMKAKNIPMLYSKVEKI